MNFDIVVENKLKEAFEAGVFDNLPGKGQPLNLNENPHEPAAWRMAYKMLREQGFTLPWIAERKDIEEAFESARKLLAQAYAETHRSKQPDVWARADWQRATDVFTDSIYKLNKRIRDYNLQVPHPTVQRALIVLEAEISRVEREASAAQIRKAIGA
jgi:DnaJ family protein C protein 28